MWQRFRLSVVPVQVHLLVSPSPGVQGRQATQGGDIGELRPAEGKASGTANTVGFYMATELSFYFSLEVGSGLAASLGVRGEQGLDLCARSQVSEMVPPSFLSCKRLFLFPLQSSGQRAPGDFPQLLTHLGRSLPQATLLRLRPRSPLSLAPHLDLLPCGGCPDKGLPACPPALHSALQTLLLVAFPRELEERERD